MQPHIGIGMTVQRFFKRDINPAQADRAGIAGDDRVRGARMDQVNPVYILRNHLAERAIRGAQDDGDPSEIETILATLSDPYTERVGLEEYAAPPSRESPELIISCSS